jgi:hypothetical protein
MEMLPRLGGKYELEIESTSKPKAEYHTDAYYALDLPVAPAIKVGEEIVVEGKDIGEEVLEAAIRRHLGLPVDEAAGKKGLLGRILGR